MLYSRHQEGIRNRTEPAEPYRTEPFTSGTGRNRTRNRTEPNRTEPLCVRKTQAEPRRTGKHICPNRTEPNDELSKSPEPKRIEPNRFLPDIMHSVRVTYSSVHVLVGTCGLCEKNTPPMRASAL